MPQNEFDKTLFFQIIDFEHIDIEKKSLRKLFYQINTLGSIWNAD